MYKYIVAQNVTYHFKNWTNFELKKSKFFFLTSGNYLDLIVEYNIQEIKRIIDYLKVIF